jgi:predicted DNA-binding transcriptional regulator YafY
MSKSIDRIKTILFYLRDVQFPTLEKIIDKLNEAGYVSSERTTQRDFKSIRDMLLIEVKFNRAKNVYYIDDESKTTFNEWLSFFELYQTAKVINETLLKSKENIDYIDFDRNKQIISELILENILQAIFAKKSILFNYQNFRRDETKKYDFNPYLLKQYQNRWYVFGTINGDEFRTFGLDRIQDLTVLNKNFKPISRKPKEFFDDVVGMIYSTSEKEKVVLSYSALQGKYIKSQPLHTSQRILIDTDEELRIELHVRINYELEEQLLKQGERVKVLEPATLKDLIKTRLKKALDNYYLRQDLAMD